MNAVILPNQPNGLAEQNSALSGHRLSWRSAGTGQPVILLHGISSGALSWEKQLTCGKLTKRCRLLAWDAPGYGNSDGLAANEPKAELYADRLMQWIEQEQLTNPVLVGHSLGAIIASAFAARYPQRLSGLILANPAQGYATAPEEKRRQVFDQRQTMVDTLGIDGYAAQRGAALLRPDARPEDIERVQQNMRRLHPDGFLQAAWMLANDDIYAYLKHYSGPVEIWCGDSDNITPAEGAIALAQHIGAEFKLIANAGHASYIDAPEIFNQRLSQFVAQYSTSTKGVSAV
ncbi:alpha/beta fold hydrolase [Budvicia aquatica]|uniref:alpha/beta fold hydrolase n=1 Tax=Budvicia aquatica TaxID=82979 RepID=UPI00207D8A59|nr:alpha/beta hydrolase [Budvicia aquatica]GKX52541.1 alpha/beta hydrolase [Budvicia aquatica]